VLGPKRERRTSKKGKKKHSLSPPIATKAQVHQNLPINPPLRREREERKRQATRTKVNGWMGERAKNDPFCFAQTLKEKTPKKHQRQKEKFVFFDEMS